MMHHQTLRMITSAINNHFGMAPMPYIVAKIKNLSEDEVDEIREARKEARQDDWFDSDEAVCEVLVGLLELNCIDELVEFDTYGWESQDFEEHGIQTHDTAYGLHFICRSEDAANYMHDVINSEYEGLMFTYEVKEEAEDDND